MGKKLNSWIFFTITIIAFINLSIYLFCKEVFGLFAFELIVSRMITIISFNFLFYALIFLRDHHLYKIIFKALLILEAPVWLTVILLQLFKFDSYRLYKSNFWDLNVLLSFSILAPGFIIYLIHYIINFTSKHEGRRIYGKFRLHEGFVGIILIIIALSLFILYSFIIRYSIFVYFAFFQNIITDFRALNLLFLFLFLISGSFLVFRDWHDVIKFKLIEVDNTVDVISNQNDCSNGLNQMNGKIFQFFKTPKLVYYPLGLIVHNFAVSAIAYGMSFLPWKIFHLEYDSIVMLGLLFGFIAGGMIGKDWLRFCKKFYPDLYQKIVSKNMSKSLKYARIKAK